MKRPLTYFGALMALVIILPSCTSELECEPVVVVTDIDYTSDPLSVPYTDVHQVFAENYSGADLSLELRAEIIESMREKAIGVGEDPDILYECIRATYPDWNTRPDRIPCYAEKCVYTNESIWAIAFNRANSFEEATLGHFDLFFVSYATYDTLYHTGCFSTD
jgi:hypothetical protein